MPKSVNEYDIYNKNFESWVKDMVNSMTDVQRNLLPDDLLFRLTVRKKGLSGDLSFNEILYILTICFGKDVCIVIKDEDKGITPQDFAKATAALNGKGTNTDVLNVLKTKGAFVLANKNLFESIAYMNHVSSTEIWTLVNKLNTDEKSKRRALFDRGKDSVDALAKLLLNYEKNKKRLCNMFMLTSSELYAILYFSQGEKYGVDFYNNDFKYAYNSNRTQMNQALVKFHRTGILLRRGTVQKHQYVLSAKGFDLLIKIIKEITKLNRI